MPPLLVDGHLDLAYNAAVLGRDVRQPVTEIRAHERKSPPPGRHTETCLVSIPDLIEGRIGVIGGSLFVAPAWKRWQEEPQAYHNAKEAHQQANVQLDFYRRLDDEAANVRLLQTTWDLDTVLATWETEQPQLGIFVIMEGADPIRTPDELEAWVERGVRGIGLSWSAGTRYAGGNGNPGPLTDLGHELLEAMAEFQLLVDLSHLWEDAAYEVLDRYPGPTAASHANPRAFVDSPRQLSDRLIERIAQRDGVIGIVPYNRMLEPDWRKSDRRLPLRRVVEAIDYVCQLLGSAEHVGLGSDFDGGLGRESVPQEIETVRDLGKIAPLLRERGYEETNIAHILRDNWLRRMRAALDAF
jgi:membrane dipeptidase